MIDSSPEISEKTIGISGQESEGEAGRSREVSQCDQIVTGAVCTGQNEISELEWAKRHVKEETEEEEKEEKKEEDEEEKQEEEVGKDKPAPQLVERKTELHCIDPVPIRKRKRAARDGAGQGTKTPDPGVLYRNLETAVRELSGPLLDWQELMGVRILTRLNELEYRMDEIEYGRDHPSPSAKPMCQGKVAK